MGVSKRTDRTVRKWREHRPDITLLLMTGQFTREVADRTRQLGVPVLEKPFSLTALRAAIEELSRGRK